VCKPKGRKEEETSICYYGMDVITKWMNYEHRLNEKEDEEREIYEKVVQVHITSITRYLCIRQYLRMMPRFSRCNKLRI